MIGNLQKMFGNLWQIVLNFVVYIINRILHVHLWIQILSSRVQLNISQVSKHSKTENSYPRTGI